MKIAQTIVARLLEADEFDFRAYMAQAEQDFEGFALKEAQAKTKDKSVVRMARKRHARPSGVP